MRFFHRQQQPTFSVSYIDILNMSGPKGHRYSCRGGRKNYGFIYIVHGAMQYDFLGKSPEHLTAHAGTLLYIPKDCAYFTTYLEDGTEHKTVQFDLLSGTLPEYLSAPRTIPCPTRKAFWTASSANWNPLFFIGFPAFTICFGKWIPAVPVFL